MPTVFDIGQGAKLLLDIRTRLRVAG
jgi:hypothetical protein